MYKDKNGVEIKAGMFIQHDEGDCEEVFACGDNDLGILASNPDYLKMHIDADPVYYPLSEFTLSEWRVVSEV